MVREPDNPIRGAGEERGAIPQVEVQMLLELDVGVVHGSLATNMSRPVGIQRYVAGLTR